MDKLNHNWHDSTALMAAAERGHPTTCIALIEGNADVNRATSAGLGDFGLQTAMTWACRSGWHEVCKVLIEAKGSAPPAGSNPC